MNAERLTCPSPPARPVRPGERAGRAGQVVSQLDRPVAGRANACEDGPMPSREPTEAPAPALPASLDPLRREVFQARVDRWWPDLREALAAVYPDADDVARRAVDIAAAAYARRDDELHALDLERTLAPDWFQIPH